MSSESMEKIISLAKRRGFVFPSSEIYGGIGGFWDWGPYGVELKNNIKQAWWRSMVWEHENIVGVDAAIIVNPKVWQATKHTEKFADLLTDCKKCKLRFRADHLIESNFSEEEGLAYLEDIKKINNALKKIKCPNCGGSFTEARSFNLMFKTNIGPVESKSSTAYLRPETAQGIFTNFSLIKNSSRLKLPFGIAQIGKAFRNEITPGNFVFRSREFEQAELEFFVDPESDKKEFERWKKARLAWFKSFGINPKNLRLRQHRKDELAHYAKEATDVEYNFPFGWKELEGIANRTDYDLKVHQELSGSDLSYFDEKTGKKFFPYVIEPSVGIDRAALAFLCDAYTEEQAPTAAGEKELRVVLKLHKDIAPIQVAILPLSKRKDLSKEAKKIWKELSTYWRAEYDETQSIGKRYRRQDEIGTPYCITIDFDTLKDKAVTIRNRDTMKQERIKIAKLTETLGRKFKQ